MNDSPRRILVLTTTFPRGPHDGGPAFVFDLCRALAAAGHHVTVLAPHASGAKRAERLGGVAVRRFRYAPPSWQRLAYDGGIMANLRRWPLLYALLPVFLLAEWAALLRCLRRGTYHEVHAHWIIPNGLLLAAALPFAARRPHALCIVHGSDVQALRGRLWALLRRWAAARLDRLVAVSGVLRARLLAEGCPASGIEVIPMGTDLQRTFVPDDSPRSETELLFVGRLVAGKGLDVLLEALPAIRRRHPACTLTVIGAGPESACLQRRARRAASPGAVNFVGALPHEALPAWYRRAALLIVPSREEGFGLVAVEALGCGCPVVASDLPALREILLDGRAGALFRAGDAEALAKTVCALLEDAPRRVRLAAEGRRQALARYDLQAVAARLVQGRGT